MPRPALWLLGLSGALFGLGAGVASARSPAGLMGSSEAAPRAAASTGIAGPVGDAVPTRNSPRPEASDAGRDRALQAEAAPRIDPADALSPDLLLGALAMETAVRADPEPSALVLGYLRAGTVVRRAAEPAGRRGCPDGWYKVEPRGYVCVGSTATLDAEHPLLGVTAARPNRRAGLPYRYGRSRYPAPPLYSALPTGALQQKSEPDLPAHLPKAFGLPWAGSVSHQAPPALATGTALPRPFGLAQSGAVYRGRALPKSAFAFTELFESGGRSWGLTTDYSIIPLDRVTPINQSSFSGVRLGPGEGLPVAFVRKQGEQLFAGDPDQGLSIVRPVQFREGFRLSGRVVRSGGVTFRETAEGQFLRDHQQLLIVYGRKELPKPARRHRTFIEVSLERQTLIAYEDGQPVLATLISAGRDGAGDPETTFSTVQGFFLVHTKHVTATMSGDEADDEFDLRDVPYVQYFHEGYALHAAYWHDGFGTPRSHGCINLAPEDARFLFGWTDPPVPEAWHTALSREGTLLYVHL